MSHVYACEHFSIEVHPCSNRLMHICLSDKGLHVFLERIHELGLGEQRLTYVPYLRLIAADILQDVLSQAIVQRLQNIINDRETGGFVVSVKGDLEMDDQVALGTAISHMIGLPNFDDMSGNFFAAFEVRDTDTSDSYLRQAYRRFTLHTDGTYVTEPTDWILMMKLGQEHAMGGESLLLHLDDWEACGYFANHKLAGHPFVYKSPPSKNYAKVVNKTTFYERHGHPCVCFIDQFVYPETFEEAQYLYDLSNSMEASEGVVTLPLPVNHLVVLNNHFWLHGRAAFEKHPKLSRVMMRQRGYFHDGEAV